ncbi:ATP-binding protein [Flavobacterium sp.]|jgi:predicted ATP-dependent endonuclease of OLD family|uniref:AAA family ATPase n=1 Tax=Flavobacterium sp. TaxID=239 RepID=UPI0022C248E4|nr:ATP-binding protein [Flavobacterium sp.]MCZ8090332.1 AAA family ATPase [Flavobacterium sp.]
MKVRKLKLVNYKKFVVEKNIDFTNTENEVNYKTLLIGENGCGKTSVLQAIVFLVASLTKEKFTIEKMNWQGFDLRLAQTGKMPLQIEAEIEFTDEEIENTGNSINQLINKGFELYTLRKVSNIATIFYDFQKQRVSVKNVKQLNLFKGYQYAKMLTSYENNTASLFDNIGNIYWYTDLRMADNGLIFSLETKDEDKVLPALDRLRNYLAKAYYYHISKQQVSSDKNDYFDLFEKFNELYSKVFPGRKFVGAVPRFDRFEEENAPDFYLTDGRNQYELSELSAGERAIFPILMDFARRNINNSIIIIDEIELHLHPPLQQQLIRVLSQLGKNNQFIFTSHSEPVFNMFKSSEIIRLENE